MVRCERQRKHEEEVTRCRTELEHAEKDAEFGRAINDMLASQKAHNVTFGSRTCTQLFDSMRELSDAYDAVMEVVSEKLKDCVKGR